MWLNNKRWDCVQWSQVSFLQLLPLSVCCEPLHRQTALLERTGYALFSDTAKGDWHKAKGELLSEELKCQQRCCTALQSLGLLCIKTEQMLVGQELCHIQSRTCRPRQSLLRWHEWHCPGFSVPALPLDAGLSPSHVWSFTLLKAVGLTKPCCASMSLVCVLLSASLNLLVSCSDVPQKHKGSEVISSCIPCENRQLGVEGRDPSGACAGGKDIGWFFITREFSHRRT